MSIYDLVKKRVEFEPPERTGDKWEDLKAYIAAQKKFLLHVNQNSKWRAAIDYSAHRLAFISLIENEIDQLERIEKGESDV